jgi:hypothetical protein
VQTNAAQAGAAVPPAPTDSPGSSTWLGSLISTDPSGHKNARAPRLNFRFETSTTAISTPLGSVADGSAATAAAAAAAAAVPAEGDSGAMPIAAEAAQKQAHDYKDFVDSMLRRTAPPSPFLATLVYTPTAQFARQCCSILPAAPVARGTRDVLQKFIDNFVGESLLPRVLLDSKTAAAGILQHKQAFATSAGVTSTANADMFVLQVCSPHVFCIHVLLVSAGCVA